MENICVTRKNNYVYGPPLTKEELGHEGFGCFIYENCIKNDNVSFQVESVTGQTDTYTDFLKKSKRVALELKSRGVRKNDIIGLCSWNSMESFICIVAAQFLNAITTCTDPLQSPRDLIYLWNDIKPKLIFVQHSTFNHFHMAMKGFTFKAEIVVIGDETGDSSFSDFLKPHEDEDNFKPLPNRDTNKIDFLIFSSGSTGMPKPLKVSGFDIINATVATNEYGIFGKVLYHSSSLYWVTALITTIATILNNAKKIILPNFEIETIYKGIQDYKIEAGPLATLFVSQVTEDLTTRYDLSSLKCVTVVGSVVSNSSIERYRRLIPNATVVAGYGSTETVGYSLVFPTKGFETGKISYPNSVGIPTPGTVVKVVDIEKGHVLGPNQQGEICIKSKYVFKGYYNKDSSNAFDKEGFVKTGDLGYYTEENYFHICDKIKDMFTFRYCQIIPASIEGVIMQHPAVKEAVVIGIPHVDDGNHAMALVVFKDGFNSTNTTVDNLLDFIHGRVLEREHLLAGLRIVENLLKTPSGKLRRIVIRKAVLEGRL